MHNQTKNQSANVAGSSNVSVAALGLIDLVPALTVEELERTTNVLIALTPVSLAWDLKVRNPCSSKDHQAKISTWQPQGNGNQISK